MDELSARIRELLATFTRDVSKVVRDGVVELATGALDRAAEPVVGRASRGSRVARRGRTRAPKADAGLVKGRVLAAIGSRPGLRSEELRSLLGLERAVFAPAVRALIRDGAVRSKGVKRSTRYVPTSPMSTKARPGRRRRAKGRG